MWSCSFLIKCLFVLYYFSHTIRAQDSFEASDILGDVTETIIDSNGFAQLVRFITVSIGSDNGDYQVTKDLEVTLANGTTVTITATQTAPLTVYNRLLNSFIPAYGHYDTLRVCDNARLDNPLFANNESAPSLNVRRRLLDLGTVQDGNQAVYDDNYQDATHNEQRLYVQTAAFQDADKLTALTLAWNGQFQATLQTENNEWAAQTAANQAANQVVNNSQQVLSALAQTNVQTNLVVQQLANQSASDFTTAAAALAGMYTSLTALSNQNIAMIAFLTATINMDQGRSFALQQQYLDINYQAQAAATGWKGLLGWIQMYISKKTEEAELVSLYFTYLDNFHQYAPLLNIFLPALDRGIPARFDTVTWSEQYSVLDRFEVHSVTYNASSHKYIVQLDRWEQWRDIINMGELSEVMLSYRDVLAKIGPIGCLIQQQDSCTGWGTWTHWEMVWPFVTPPNKLDWGDVLFADQESDWFAGIDPSQPVTGPIISNTTDMNQWGTWFQQACFNGANWTSYVQSYAANKGWNIYVIPYLYTIPGDWGDALLEFCNLFSPQAVLLTETTLTLPYLISTTNYQAYQVLATQAQTLVDSLQGALPNAVYAETNYFVPGLSVQDPTTSSDASRTCNSLSVASVANQSQPVYVMRLAGVTDPITTITTSNGAPPPTWKNTLRTTSSGDFFKPLVWTLIGYPVCLNRPCAIPLGVDVQNHQPFDMGLYGYNNNDRQTELFDNLNRRENTVTMIKERWTGNNSESDLLTPENPYPPISYDTMVNQSDGGEFRAEMAIFDLDSILVRLEKNSDRAYDVSCIASPTGESANGDFCVLAELYRHSPVAPTGNDTLDNILTQEGQPGTGTTSGLWYLTPYTWTAVIRFEIPQGSVSTLLQDGCPSSYNLTTSAISSDIWMTLVNSYHTAPNLDVVLQYTSQAIIDELSDPCFLTTEISLEPDQSKIVPLTLCNQPSQVQIITRTIPVKICQTTVLPAQSLSYVQVNSFMNTQITQIANQSSYRSQTILNELSSSIQDTISSTQQAYQLSLIQNEPNAALEALEQLGLRINASSSTWNAFEATSSAEAARLLAESQLSTAEAENIQNQILANAQAINSLNVFTQIISQQEIVTNSAFETEQKFADQYNSMASDDVNFVSNFFLDSKKYPGFDWKEFSPSFWANLLSIPCAIWLNDIPTGDCVVIWYMPWTYWDWLCSDYYGLKPLAWCLSLLAIIIFIYMGCVCGRSRQIDIYEVTRVPYLSYVYDDDLYDDDDPNAGTTCYCEEFSNPKKYCCLGCRGKRKCCDKYQPGDLDSIHEYDTKKTTKHEAIPTSADELTSEDDGEGKSTEMTDQKPLLNQEGEKEEEEEVGEMSEPESDQENSASEGSPHKKGSSRHETGEEAHIKVWIPVGYKKNVN